MKKVIIITARAGYPNGFGASSILRKYAKGFNQNGYEVSILLLRPSEKKENNPLNLQYKGNDSYAKYEYMCKTVYTCNSSTKRLQLYIISIIRTLIHLVKNRSDLSTVFVYSPDYFLSVYLMQIVCKFLKIRCCGIKTESSFCDVQRLRKKLWKIRERLIYRNFKCMIVITTHLKNQLINFGYKKNVKILPILIDEEMYSDIRRFPKEKTLIYLGSLGYEKELQYLFESCSKVFSEHSDWKLIVIGGWNDEGIRQRILELIEKLAISDKISWMGKMNSDDVAKALARGGIMLLPRENDEYSQAGFPIKLGEYLLSGAPVVVTDTGDISKYLVADVDAYLVEANNVGEFAKKVIYVIEHYKEALKVGDKGREASLRFFGTRQICRKMMECNDEK